MRIVAAARSLAFSIRAGIRARGVVRREKIERTEICGAVVFYPGSSVIGASVASGAGWESTLPSVLEALVIDDADVVIAEVGSNIGVSLAQMIAVRPAARYICFEPSERFREVLLRNVRENRWNGITVEPALLASRNGSVRLFTNTSTASAATRDYGGHEFLGSARISATTLDDYFANQPRLDFLKSDTDGFDADVLLGGRATLRRLQPSLYFEFAPFLLKRADRSPADLLLFLAELGYARFLAFSQDGAFLGGADDHEAIVRLAEAQGYVDLVTSPRASAIAALEAIAAAQASIAPPSLP
jgi:FkbM family methyltransferase